MKDCAEENTLKKLFNNVEYYKEGYTDDTYFMEYGNYEIYIYCNNKIISDNSRVFIKGI